MSGLWGGGAWGQTEILSGLLPEKTAENPTGEPAEVTLPKMTQMKNDPEVEKIAIEVAKEYEVSQGRKPVSVEEENCGWDISSLKGNCPDFSPIQTANRLQKPLNH